MQVSTKSRQEVAAIFFIIFFFLYMPKGLDSEMKTPPPSFARF